MTDSADRINVQTLRLLADQGALSTNQVFAQLTRGRRHSALTALIHHAEAGRVTRVGQGEPRGRRGPSPTVWEITASGREWLDHPPQRRGQPASTTALANCAQANAARSASAANRDAEVALALLADWPDGWPSDYRRVTEARAAHPDWTWAQIGGSLGLSKDAAVSCWRRLTGPAGSRELFLQGTGAGR